MQITESDVGQMAFKVLTQQAHAEGRSVEQVAINVLMEHAAHQLSEGLLIPTPPEHQQH